MSIGISIIVSPGETCALCESPTHTAGKVAVLDGHAPDSEGLVCARCLGSLANADDPHEWLREEASHCDRQAARLNRVAHRMRKLVEAGLEPPSRETFLEVAGDVDVAPF